MDFAFTPEEENFRHKLRAWLERTADEVFGAERAALGGSAASLLDITDAEHWRRMLEYHRRLYEAGYVALHWPRQWGGAGASLMEQAIYQDEVLRLGLPVYGANPLAIDRIGPTLILFGSDAQRRRFLPRMLTAEEIWCQGYSEPNAGSDLASLVTRATLDGDHFVVNGQKVWTSLAHRAHMQVLLVRTDPAASKHKGISYLIVDMKGPGVTVRPLKQMTGEGGFSEVFYDNVRVPRENLVGELNGGWKVAVATLMYERASGGTRHPVERAVNELIALARDVRTGAGPGPRDSRVRQELARLAIEARCLRLNRYRALSAQVRSRAPGPESSLGKLLATELNLRVAAFARELLGPFGLLERDSYAAPEQGQWAHRILAARGLTIAAGTSEIQRNIIGERVLKLPRG